jgi:hypothetical protein
MPFQLIQVDTDYSLQFGNESLELLSQFTDGQARGSMIGQQSMHLVELLIVGLLCQ